MNFLAHLYLAGEGDDFRLGGLMGDFIKGPLPGLLPPGLAAGVRLHRSIDSFADGHDAFQRSRHRVGPERRRYSGILVDMFYDHFLACHWSRFHAQPLEAYASTVYGLLQARESALPDTMVPMVRAMAAGDWLTSYRDARQVDLALARMGQRRLPPPNPLAGALAVLAADYAGFEADFLAFLPDAMTFCDVTRKQLLAGVSPR